MSHLYSDFNSLLEHYIDYDYDKNGIDKSTVKTTIDDVIYRTMSLDELKEIITKSVLRLTSNDIIDNDRFHGVDLNDYYYYKSFFRILTPSIVGFYEDNECIVEFDRFIIKSLPNCRLAPLNWFYNDSGYNLRSEFQSEDRLYSKNETVKIKDVKKLVKRIWIKKSENPDKELLKEIKKLGIPLRYSPSMITSMEDLFSRSSSEADKENLYNFNKKTYDKIIYNLYVKSLNDYINNNKLLYSLAVIANNDENLFKNFKEYNNKYYIDLEDNSNINKIYIRIRREIKNYIIEFVKDYFESRTGISYKILDDAVLKNTKKTFKIKKFVKTKYGFLLQNKRKNKNTNKIEWLNIEYYANEKDIMSFIDKNFDKILSNIEFLNKSAVEYVKRLHSKLIYQNSLVDFLKPNNFKNVLSDFLLKDPIFNANNSKFIVVSDDRDSLIEEIKTKLEEYIDNKIKENNKGGAQSAYNSEFDRVSFIRRNINKILDKIEFVDELSLNKNKETILREVCEIYLDKLLEPNNFIEEISNIRNISYTYEKSSNMIFLETNNINNVKKKIEKIVINYIFLYLDLYFEDFNLNIDKNFVARYVKENKLKLFNNIEFGNNNKFMKQGIEIFKNKCKKYFKDFLEISNLENLLSFDYDLTLLWDQDKNKLIVKNNSREILEQIKDDAVDFLLDKMIDDDSLSNYKIDENKITTEFVDDNFYKILKNVQFCSEMEFDKNAKPIVDKIFEWIKAYFIPYTVVEILKSVGFEAKISSDYNSVEVETENLRPVVPSIKKLIIQYVINDRDINSRPIIGNNREFIKKYIKTDNEHVSSLFDWFFNMINAKQ